MREIENTRDGLLHRGRFWLQQVDDAVGEPLFAKHDAHVVV